ncbi:MAG: hypothetical protein R2729_29505 [Bryobacteraceae bacterium]
MKHKLLAIVAAGFLTLAPMTAFAQASDPACPNCPNGGIQKRDGSGGQGAKKNQRKGQGQGQHDGSGQRTPQRNGRGGGGRR